MKRTWLVDAVDEDGTFDLSEAAHQASLAIPMLANLGGAIIIAADREQVGAEEYETTRFIFRYESFIPAQRREAEAVTGDPEPEVADVVVGGVTEPEEAAASAADSDA